MSSPQSDRVPSLRAALLAVVIFVHGVAASPLPPSPTTPKAMANPIAVEELNGWVKVLGGLGIETTRAELTDLAVKSSTVTSEPSICGTPKPSLSAVLSVDGPRGGVQTGPIPPGEVPPEKVDELADQMLARLAVSERRQRFFDPDDVPGGKWTVAAAGGVAVVLVLLSLFAVLGALFSR